MGYGSTNAQIVSSFNKSIIIVSAPPGVILTATLNNVTKLGIEKLPGEYWIENLDIGEWELKLVKDEKFAIKKFNITEFGVYRTIMSFFSATIKITYPIGSECTCSKDNDTYTAPDTSGTWECIVDSAGDWMVTCTDGNYNDFKIATITADGQVISISLAYELVLYDRGKQYADVSGGWEIIEDDNGFSAEFKIDHILISCDEYWTDGSVQTKIPIDRDGFTTLCADVSVVGASDVYEAFEMNYGGSYLRIPVGDNTVKLDVVNTNNQIVKFEHHSGGRRNGALMIKRVYFNDRRDLE